MMERATWLARFLLCSTCVIACQDDDLSLGENRCIGDRVRCKIPCGNFSTIQQRSVEVAAVEKELQARWQQPLCQADACEELERPDSMDFLLHDHGEVTTASLWNSAEPRPLLEVSRFSPDGDVLWTYERTFDDSAPPSWMAMAENAPSTTEIVFALHGLQASGERSATSTMVFELDASGAPRPAYTLRNSRRPLTMARWKADLLVVSDMEASLYDPAGELKWRQSAIGQGPEAGDPPTFSYYRAARIIEYKGRPLILRREPSNVQSLVQLDEDGNVTWYSYAPPLPQGTSDGVPPRCRASEDGIYAENAPPRLQQEAESPQVDFEHGPLFVDALPVLDSEQRLIVATSGYSLARFDEPLPTPAAGEFHFAPDAIWFPRTLPVYGGFLMGLDINDEEQLHVMALTAKGDEARRVIERFSPDLKQAEQLLLPAELDGAPTGFRGLRLASEDTLYTLGYGRSNAPRPVLLVRFELPASPL